MGYKTIWQWLEGPRLQQIKWLILVLILIAVTAIYANFLYLQEQSCKEREALAGHSLEITLADRYRI